MLYGIILFLVGAFLYGIAKTYPEGQVFYLQMLNIALMALSTLLIYQSVKNKGLKRSKEAVSYTRVILTFALGVLYVLAIPYLGYILSTVIFLMVTMWLLGFKKPVPVVMVAIGCAAVIYFGFQRGLSIPLPAGSLLSNLM
jgi:putative tricarboxylic transport membrane protein